jgi:hypothetical protein
MSAFRPTTMRVKHINVDVFNYSGKLVAGSRFCLSVNESVRCVRALRSPDGDKLQNFAVVALLLLPVYNCSIVRLSLRRWIAKNYNGNEDTSSQLINSTDRHFRAFSQKLTRRNTGFGRQFSITTPHSVNYRETLNYDHTNVYNSVRYISCGILFSFSYY